MRQKRIHYCQASDKTGKRVKIIKKKGGPKAALCRCFNRAYRSVQEMQGSMLLTMSGMSATWAPAIITWRASQFM